MLFWVRLVRLIGEKGGLRFWKWPNYKNEIYNNYKYIYIYIYIYINLDPGGRSPLGPHLSPSLSCSLENSSEKIMKTTILILILISLTFNYDKY